jgi:hypothetical protein
MNHENSFTTSPKHNNESKLIRFTNSNRSTGIPESCSEEILHVFYEKKLRSLDCGIFNDYENIENELILSPESPRLSYIPYPKDKWEKISEFSL